MAALNSYQAALASHEEIVKAPFDVVLNLLQEKVYHPERSVPGISNVRIIHDSKDGKAGVERKMFQSLRGDDIHELITWESSAGHVLMTFSMLSDKQLEGTVTNEAIAVEPGVTRIKYVMNWVYRADVLDAERKAPFPDAGAGVIRAALLSMKDTAESAAIAAAAADSASSSIRT